MSNDKSPQVDDDYFNSKLICIVGLGYVGLPLAVEFGKNFRTIGFDLNETRVDNLKKQYDITREVTPGEIKSAVRLTFTSDINDVSKANVYIVAVPTPVDEFKKPDLSALHRASELVGRVLQKNNLVIFESTVYPGATEEECVPILEKISGLHFNEDFTVGYSPERINPGDKTRTLTSIVKVVSGSTMTASFEVNKLYSAIINAGTYLAESIKVAEAAKVIENIQRDLNIGLINELAMLFSKMDINIEQVLLAAETKWNFLPFRPGLVGGHCIGVDPYYLTHKAQSIGFNPELILAARRVNDAMPEFVAGKVVKAMVQNKLFGVELKILVMGFTFKEDCPDIRNTKVANLIYELQSCGIDVECFDPVMDQEDAKSSYSDINVIADPKLDFYDAVVLAVAHSQFRDMELSGIRTFCRKKHIICDLKYLFGSGNDVVNL